MVGPYGGGQPITFTVLEVTKPRKSTGGSEFMGIGKDAKGNMYDFRGRSGYRGAGGMQPTPNKGDVLRGRLEYGITGENGYPRVINVEPADSFN